MTTANHSENQNNIEAQGSGQINDFVRETINSDEFKKALSAMEKLPPEQLELILSKTLAKAAQIIKKGLKK